MYLERHDVVRLLLYGHARDSQWFSRLDANVCRLAKTGCDRSFFIKMIGTSISLNKEWGIVNY